ncbi:MAG TPA: hypothetical protein VES42_02960 [Pilimelia sp.]|nr:hypothetical protein [Pilimelia sp.]
MQTSADRFAPHPGNYDPPQFALHPTRPVAQPHAEAPAWGEPPAWTDQQRRADQQAWTEQQTRSAQQARTEHQPWTDPQHRAEPYRGEPAHRADPQAWRPPAQPPAPPYADRPAWTEPAYGPPQQQPAAPPPAGHWPPLEAAAPDHPLLLPVAAPDLRFQVANRLREMNWAHAKLAWERRRKDAISPHALAFFYAEPAVGEPPRHTLRTATRLFLAGPEATELPGLLFELDRVAQRFQEAGDFDPRLRMSNRADEMSPQARYIGVGVSSLDSPRGQWAASCQRAASALHIPGRAFALLDDGAAIQLDRAGLAEFNRCRLLSTHAIDVIPSHPISAFTQDRQLTRRNDPTTDEIWHWIGVLHRRVAAGVPQ